MHSLARSTLHRQKINRLEEEHDEEIANLKSAIKEWCEASNQWYEDLADDGRGGGLPKTLTRMRLYLAGRKLFDLSGVKPHPYGIYDYNIHVEPKK